MSQRTRPPVVIVAEDDPVARGLVVAEISRAGYLAIPHRDGLSALEYIALGERADALVTDVHMPGSIDGLFLAVEARAQRPYLPVLYMSARFLRAQSMVPGSRFLPKPYPVGELVSMLRVVMSASAAQMLAETWSLYAEIERRFVVADDGWMDTATGWLRLTDGILGELHGPKVRVQRDDERAWLTVKRPRKGLQRSEIEYEMPSAQAEVLLASGSADEPLMKVRHLVLHSGIIWMVDVYKGRLEGLVLAEIELLDEAQELELPPWVGREVTGDPRFGRKGLQMLAWQQA